MQPLIGVTAGETVNKLYPHSPAVQGQSYTYIDAVVHAGGAPFIMPLTEDEAILRRLYEQCQGILFSGGNDLDPASYNEEPAEKTVDFSSRRDHQELQLLKWALADDKPVLAICRGMQLLNVAQGGTLYQDIPTELPDAENHNISAEKKRESRIVHTLRIKPDSKLAKVLGVTELGTNAYHHQAIKKSGKDLVASAWAEDDIIEAVELPNRRFVLGLQSHPESLEAKIEPRWHKLFASFVAASAGS
jgi:putative glutamine amidotransferase